SEITVAKEGVFADYDLNKIPARYNEGGVDVGGSVQPTSSPMPDGFTVVIDTVVAKAGDKVEIPIRFNNVPSSGINNCDFILWYDPDVVDVTEIVPGSIIINGAQDFKSYINKDNGRLSFMFVDETGLGNRMIK